MDSEVDQGIEEDALNFDDMTDRSVTTSVAINDTQTGTSSSTATTITTSSKKCWSKSIVGDQNTET